ncbi:Site-specific recombinase XerD [Actinopolyspora alba]|uniref:Site-specific recombinase XerD n=1 Tax=Actinopolyspora alba TaxID=673379 RepID=A0A1I2B2I0_9ACTN|nr:site-specific integrase [Actinopolyspora alba]SFE50098.1 Site-specific recombinase XerD [Actinopolyspora alba]
MARVWIEDRSSHSDYKQALAQAKTSRKAAPGRWRVRWYDQFGKQKTQTFRRKPDAEERQAALTQQLADGSYRDPSAARVRLSEVADEWFAAQHHLERSSVGRYREHLELYVKPRWGSVRVNQLRRDDIEQWIGELGRDGGGARGDALSPSAVRGIHRVLHMVLARAVETGRIAVNPAKGVSLPRVASSEHVYLDYEQLDRLAEAAGTYRLLIYLLGFTGLRWGEASAVRAGRVDVDARRVHVVEAFAKDSAETYLTDPKTHERRTVPLPAFLADELRPVVSGQRSETFVFTSRRGQPLRYANFRSRVFAPAVREAKLDHLDGLSLHSLRHTAASLAIAAGADVKVVQQMLGHKTATMTLDTYGHLFPDRLDEVADRMDAARSRALAPADETGDDSV